MELQRPTRRIVSLGLVVVGCVALLVANLAAWSRYELLDTDRFVAALEPLARDQDVIDGVADELSDRIVEVEPRAPRRVVDRVVREVLELPQFETIWSAAVRQAHKELLRIAHEGGDQVRLEFEDVLNQVDSTLETLGIDVLDEDTIERIDDIVPWESERLHQLVVAIDLIEELAFVLPPVTLALLTVAVVLSTDRPRTLRLIGIGAVLAMALTAVAIWIGRGRTMTRIDEDVARRAAGDVWDNIFESLYDRTFLIGGIGLVLALGAWLAIVLTGRRSTVAMD